MSQVVSQLLGMSQIAAMLGVSRQRVHQLCKSYPDWPQPVATVGGRRIWTRDEIEQWLDRHPLRPLGRPRRQDGG